MILLKRKKRKSKQIKKADLFLILALLLLANLSALFFVSLITDRSANELCGNVLIGIHMVVLLVAILKKRTERAIDKYPVFLLSQAIIFFFLLSHPRLIEKLNISIFYFCGIILYFSVKRIHPSFAFLLLLYSSVSELFCYVLINRNFIFLSVFRNFIILSAGYLTGYSMSRSE